MRVGVWLQLAVRVSVVPLVGTVEDGVIVQIGNTPAADQVTASDTGVPVPWALVPATA